MTKSEYMSTADYFNLEHKERTFNVGLGDFMMVGGGEQTSNACGQFMGWSGCDRVEKHDKVTVDGVNHRGKVFIKKPLFHSCFKASCPICYRDWAVRQARKIEHRILEASKRFGEAQHIIVTFPIRFWQWSVERLRLKAKELLRSRGVIGSSLIFHAGRYNKRKVWYLSPHFHTISFILGGYPCRTCKPVRETGKCGIENRECNGFVNRQYRMYEKDGCILKVKGKRKSIFRTALYLLSHSTVKAGVERFHVVTWMGCVAYSKLKVTKEMRKPFCPICGEPLVKLRYVGWMLDCWVLWVGNSEVSYLEEPRVEWFAPVIAWERILSSVSYEDY